MSSEAQQVLAVVWIGVALYGVMIKSGLLAFYLADRQALLLLKQNGDKRKIAHIGIRNSAFRLSVSALNLTIGIGALVVNQPTEQLTQAQAIFSAFFSAVLFYTQVGFDVMGTLEVRDRFKLLEG